MKRNFLRLILFVFIPVLPLNCQSNTAKAEAAPCKYLSFADAQKIIGWPVEIDENRWITENNTKCLNCSYSAISFEKPSDVELRVLFSFEEFPNEEQAKKTYQQIWESNKNHGGIELLKGAGDEAYYHTDYGNFIFVMGRKGKFTIRFKVRRALKTNSSEALKLVSKNIINQL